MGDFKIHTVRTAYSHSLFVSHCCRLCCHDMRACLITLMSLLSPDFPRNFSSLLIPDSAPFHVILYWIILNKIYEEQILLFWSSRESLCFCDLSSTYYPQQRDVRLFLNIYLSFRSSQVYNKRWFKYDRDCFVCKQAALRSSCATLREWSHSLHPPSCSG